jgi:hypothetical protein
MERRLSKPKLEILPKVFNRTNSQVSNIHKGIKVEERPEAEKRWLFDGNKEGGVRPKSARIAEERKKSYPQRLTKLRRSVHDVGSGHRTLNQTQRFRRPGVVDNPAEFTEDVETDVILLESSPTTNEASFKGSNNSSGEHERESLRVQYRKRNSSFFKLGEFHKIQGVSRVGDKMICSVHFFLVANNIFNFLGL